MRSRNVRTGARRHPGRCLVLGLVALGGLFPMRPHPLRAQTTEQMREHIEGLLPAYDRAWEEARAADSLKRERERLENEVSTDTFSVGPFRVVARDHQRRLATRTFERVLSEYGGMLHGAEELFQPFFFEFQYARRPVTLYIEPDMASGERLFQAVMEPSFFRGKLETGVQAAIGKALLYNLPEDFGRWVSNEGLAPYRAYEWYYRRFATVPSQAVRLCFAGELDSCWEAVGASQEGHLWERWYTDADRREFVRTLDRGQRGGGDELLWDGCVEEGIVAACDAFLKRRFDEPVIPLSGAFRATLTFRALQMGGEGAYLRLISSDSPSPRDRLVYTAGVDADSLMSAWRAEIMGSRPRQIAGLSRAGASALAWILLLLFLAARSTRWRLG